MDAAPFALVLALTLVPDETVEAGRETVEETRVLDACLSVVFTCPGTLTYRSRSGGCSWVGRDGS